MIETKLQNALPCGKISMSMKNNRQGRRSAVPYMSPPKGASLTKGVLFYG